MIIGFFSDAHGNEIGFTKCYNYLVKHSDVIYYLGDTVGYFPLSNKIIDILREDNIGSLKGNHDAMFLGELPQEEAKEKIYQLKRGEELITNPNRSFLKGLSPEMSFTIEGRKILLVHGSPFNPLEGYVYQDTDISDFEELGYDLIIMGHTHRSFIKKIGRTTVVNVGSCGLPRDNGNKLTVGLYYTDCNEAVIQDIQLNVEKVLEKFENEIHPEVKNVLLRNNKIYDNQ
jgi:putative phosphoesterase